MDYLMLLVFGFPVALWLCYVPLFWVLGRAHVDNRKLLWWEWPIAILFAGVGYPLDLITNLIHGTVIFWQRPNINRLTLSARMDDLILNGTGWRYAQALSIVARFLERFDKTGQHTTYGKLK